VAFNPAHVEYPAEITPELLDTVCQSCFLDAHNPK